MQVAWLFPGQGSQSVGMCKDIFDASPAAREVLARADAALAEPLSKLILEGPESDLTLTANAQPAIVATSVAVLAALRERFPELPAPRFAAGHSLGEYSALVAAGALSLEDAIRLVRARGLAMQDAVRPGEGAMAAIMVLDPAKVEGLCREVSEEKDESGAPYGLVSCANFNGPSQIVIAGTTAAVERVCRRADEAGGRAKMLKVSAPFHCSLMAPAAEALAAELAKIEVRPLAFPVVANVDARPNADASRVKDLLVRQVVGAVRWEQAVRLMHLEGITRAIEIGPGKVLAGLCKRIAKELSVVCTNDLATFENAGPFAAGATVTTGNTVPPPASIPPPV